MNNKVVLLSGVHGVGKSFFVQSRLSGIKNLNICSASQLIYQYKDREKIGYKLVSDVSANQDILLMAIKYYQNQNPGNILLDGHICLLNNKSEVERVPLEFFLGVPISAIILLQDTVPAIKLRQCQRDNISMDHKLIKLLQSEEEDYCSFLRKEYSIPYIKISPSDSKEKVLEIIDCLTGKEYNDCFGQY